MGAVRLVLLIAFAPMSCVPGAADAPPASRPEARAVAFLAREVPEWPVRNKCYSCHNNGDAARALYAARRVAVPFETRSLESTNRWLVRPQDWKDNDPKEEFGDQRLASLQFAHALVAAVETGAVARDETFVRAAEKVREHQDPDGSWNVDASGLAGSPITYGRTLATVVARNVLAAASPNRFAEAVRRAEAWLGTQRPRSVLDAAAILIGPATREQKVECLEVLRKGQSREGGWGPYVTAAPEVFDTSVALLALTGVREEAGILEMKARGRGFLVRAQQPDGSWPETTRPPGAESYAQRISTTGWATLALLAITP